MTATAHLVTVGAMPAAGADGAAGAPAPPPPGVPPASPGLLHDDRAGAGAGGPGPPLVRPRGTAGLGLADVEERLADWLGPDGEVTVSTIPADGEVWVRLRARASTPAEAARSAAKTDAAVSAILGDDCYGREGETLEGVVARLLIERKLTLAVAESCTGGLLSHRLTRVPGSSAYFERGG